MDQMSERNTQMEQNPSIIVVSDANFESEPARTCVLRQSRRRSRTFQQELTLVRTLFRSFAVFLVAWLPLAILLMLAPVIDVVLPSWVYLLTVFLAHGSTATNSVLYYSTNRLFRKSFRAMTEKYLSGCFQRAG
ncbi:hypothetical protein RvY_04534 [Ramazzottius varieornatus]|uniref:G-protein coupled receptors family 1 profile domain-containing protein n=1 Tax=Ramazzottius varieornatus TaxID=947166 RepID=A0A1D1URX5_RAMVA|nr:hypothetical protein RvY_04534 [Ramazzottius varieornatus]